jgi:hypothetical protein
VLQASTSSSPFPASDKPYLWKALRPQTVFSSLILDDQTIRAAHMNVERRRCQSTTEPYCCLQVTRPRSRRVNQT